MIPRICGEFKAGIYSETIRTELGKNQKFGDDCPKNDFNFTETFEKV